VILTWECTIWQPCLLNIDAYRTWMAYFQTQNRNLGKFWRNLQWKMLVYFMAIWSIIRTFGIPILWLFGRFYGSLLNFFPFWYVVSRKIWQPWARLQKPVGFYSERDRLCNDDFHCRHIQHF
jgi:hypothetical protein